MLSGVLAGGDFCGPGLLGVGVAARDEAKLLPASALGGHENVWFLNSVSLFWKHSPRCSDDNSCNGGGSKTGAAGAAAEQKV